MAAQLGGPLPFCFRPGFCVLVSFLPKAPKNRTLCRRRWMPKNSFPHCCQCHAPAF